MSRRRRAGPSRRAERVRVVDSGTKRFSTRVRVALPPEPCASVTSSSRSFGRRRFTREAIPPPGQPSVVVVGRARAFARDHAGADRPLGRARRAEDLALPGLDRTDQHLAALTRLRVVDQHARHPEPSLGVPLGELRPSLRALRSIQPRPRHSKVSGPRSSIVSSSAAIARGLPSRRTTRVYWFSTSQRPSRSWRHQHHGRVQDVDRLEAVTTTGLRSHGR